MDLRSWLSARGGWAHRTDVLEAGFTRYRIQQALRSALVSVAARQWLHLPNVDEDLLAAMRSGARLTCVSAARMIGLWIPRTPERVHLAAHPHAGRDLSGFVVHRNTGPVGVALRSPIDAIENVLARVATCVPHIEGLAIWESAINRRFVTAEHLEVIDWPSLAARRLAQEADGASDSGLETIVVHRLSRIGIAALQQVPLLGHRVDVLVGRRLVIQLDGYAFHQGEQRRSDIAHDRRLRLAGYTVLRFDYREVMERWPVVERQIVAAVAQRLHLG
ncbi:MAG TPA: DNA/RNA helicase [Microbacterium sp.]|nr:DNA/RNA helicase [Microbacterium sp.]